MSTLPDLIYSIDPGDVHVGLAVWLQGVDGAWYCHAVDEVTPGSLVKRLSAEFDLFNPMIDRTTVVVEDWRLYGDKAMTQVGSQFEAVRLIGWIQWEIARRNLPELLYMEQPASIKRPTLGWAKANGYSFRAVQEKRGGHAKDAETHGLYYLVRTLGEAVT